MRAAFTDEQMDRIIGNLLRLGVVIATVAVLLGGAREERCNA